MVDTLYLEANYKKNSYFIANRYNMLNYLPNSEDIKSGAIRLNNCLNLSFNPGKVYINIEAPQILHGNNLAPSLLNTKRDFQDLEKAVSNLCSLSGFDVDMRNAKITRMDTARDLNTLYPFEDYGRVFSSLDARYMNPNTKNKKFGLTWFNWQNSTRSITSYSKSSQAQNKGYLLSFDNVMRTETRLLKHRAIREHSSGFLSRFEDFQKDGLEDCLKFVYGKSVEGLFRYDYEEYRSLIEGRSLNIIEGVLRDTGKGKSNPVLKALSILSIDNIGLTREEALNLFYLAIDNLGIKETNYRTWETKRLRVRESINALYNEYIKYSHYRGLSLIDLYTELREGFLMVA